MEFRRKLPGITVSHKLPGNADAQPNLASRAKQQKAKSRRASPGKSSDDDTAHQVMDGDPAVLQVSCSLE